MDKKDTSTRADSYGSHNIVHYVTTWTVEDLMANNDAVSVAATKSELSGPQ